MAPKSIQHLIQPSTSTPLHVCLGLNLPLNISPKTPDKYRQNVIKVSICGTGQSNSPFKQTVIIVISSKNN